MMLSSPSQARRTASSAGARRQLAAARAQRADAPHLVALGLVVDLQRRDGLSCRSVTCWLTPTTTRSPLSTWRWNSYAEAAISRCG